MFKLKITDPVLFTLLGHLTARFQLLVCGCDRKLFYFKNPPVFPFPRGASGLLGVHLKELEDPATDPLAYVAPMPPWKPWVTK